METKRSTKEGAVTVQTPGFFVHNTLTGIAAWIEGLEEILGPGGSMNTVRIKTAIQCALAGKSYALDSCPCYAMQYSRYPVICEEHASQIAGATPSKYVVVTNCKEHGRSHYNAVAFGGQFGHSTIGDDSQAAAEHFLDDLKTEEQVATLVSKIIKENAAASGERTDN